MMEQLDVKLPPIPLGEVQDLRREGASEVLLGWTEVLGVPLVVELVRVGRHPKTGELVAISDPHGRLPALIEALRPRALYRSCAPATVRLPGYPGEWVPFVFPVPVAG